MPICIIRIIGFAELKVRSFIYVVYVVYLLFWLFETHSVVRENCKVAGKTVAFTLSISLQRHRERARCDKGFY